MSSKDENTSHNQERGEGSSPIVKRAGSSALATLKRSPAWLAALAFATGCTITWSAAQFLYVKPRDEEIQLLKTRMYETELSSNEWKDWSFATLASPFPVGYAGPRPGDNYDVQNLLGENTVYTGEKISLNLVDADFRKVMRLFHSISGINFVLDKDVGEPRVTIVLDDVPWDQALDEVLESSDLDKMIVGNLIRIVPRASGLVLLLEDARVEVVVPIDAGPFDQVTYRLRSARLDSRLVEVRHRFRSVTAARTARRQALSIFGEVPVSAGGRLVWEVAGKSTVISADEWSVRE